MEEELGLYLNCKTYNGRENMVFDYCSNEINEGKFFFDDYVYLTESKVKKIVESTKNSQQLDEKDDNNITLFRLNIKKDEKKDEKKDKKKDEKKDEKKDKKKDEKKDEKKNSPFLAFIKYNFKPPYDINSITKKDKDPPLIWEKCLWYVINSENPENYGKSEKKGKLNNKYIDKKNDEYYLKENDILKIGYYKYIVSKIYIKNKSPNKRVKVINSEPYCKGISKCEFCGKPTIKLCNCPVLYHIDEIKANLKKNCIIKNRKNVKSYYFDLLYCEENNMNKESCQVYYSLKYRCKTSDLENIELDNIKIEEKDDDTLLYLYDFEIPEDKDYMILESLEEKILNLNYAKKSFHIIELNENEIKIGKKDYNDVVLSEDKSVSKDHAIIKYDKITGNISIRNLGKLGTLALIYPEDAIVFTKKPLYFQMNRTFIEAKVMTKSDYNKMNNKKGI